MARIKLLNGDKVEEMGLYKIVGVIRKDFTVLGESNQGTKMHGLLTDLATDRKSGKGTDIKSRLPTGTGFTQAKKWIHDGHAVMHYSTGEKLQAAATHSVTVFFFKVDDGSIVIIAAGTHIDNSTDYKILWGVRSGDYGTV